MDNIYSFRDTERFRGACVHIGRFEGEIGGFGLFNSVLNGFLRFFLFRKTL